MKTLFRVRNNTKSGFGKYASDLLNMFVIFNVRPKPTSPRSDGKAVASVKAKSEGSRALSLENNLTGSRPYH